MSEHAIGSSESKEEYGNDSRSRLEITLLFRKPNAKNEPRKSKRIPDYSQHKIAERTKTTSKQTSKQTKKQTIKQPHKPRNVIYAVFKTSQLLRWQVRTLLATEIDKTAVHQTRSELQYKLRLLKTDYDFL